jgi:hypothetical protein
VEMLEQLDRVHARGMGRRMVRDIGYTRRFA